METKTEIRSIVKGRKRFALERAAMVLFELDKIHAIGTNGKRDFPLELRIESASRDVSIILSDLRFPDESGLCVDDAGPNVSRDLLKAAINGLAFRDLGFLIERIKHDPVAIAELILSTKVGLEFLEGLAVFDDDEI